jgi:nucleoside 2-deoxyribosyltransferase
LIILDGRAIDEGAAFELGFATAFGKLCVGLQTDPRRLIASRNNPMIDCALQHIFEDAPSLLRWANNFNSSNSINVSALQDA